MLREDEVIFISIDDNEVDNLKRQCNEIFGESNNIATVIWKRKRGRDNSAKWFSKSHEYILIYAKNKENFNIKFLELDEETKKAYKNPDNDERGPYRMLATWARGTQGGVEYDFTDKNGQYFKKRLWLFAKDKLIQMDNDNKLIVKGDNIYRKLFIYENKGKIPETIWSNVSNAANASDEIKNLFEKIIFDTSKPIPYILEMLKITTDKNDIILDFFSGSASTAHAIMNLNLYKNYKCKSIMVQLPEQTDEKSEAYKAGYKNICEIGKERIRRAGDKIVSENKDKEGIENLDIGFKVFKLEYNCGGENYSMMEEGIKVDIIKRPKDKPICKFKIDGELYYLVKTNEDIIVFPYKSSIKGKAIASIFNLELCKNKDYMQLEYLYNLKLNEFNGEDFVHSQYVTSVILDNVYKNLNE